MINAVLAARDDAQREKSTLVGLVVIVAKICDDLSETEADVVFAGVRCAGAITEELPAS
jgi:hypothetical protein